MDDELVKVTRQAAIGVVIFAVVVASPVEDTKVEPATCKIVGVGYHGTWVAGVLDRNLFGPGTVA